MDHGIRWNRRISSWWYDRRFKLVVLRATTVRSTLNSFGGQYFVVCTDLWQQGTSGHPGSRSGDYGTTHHKLCFEVLEGLLVLVDVAAGFLIIYHEVGKGARFSDTQTQRGMDGITPSSRPACSNPPHPPGPQSTWSTETGFAAPACQYLVSDIGPLLAHMASSACVTNRQRHNVPPYVTCANLFSSCSSW